MAQFQRIDLDFSKAETEFVEFRKFLQDNATFSERDVVAQLKKRQHLSCLIGSMPAGVKGPTSTNLNFRYKEYFGQTWRSAICSRRPLFLSSSSPVKTQACSGDMRQTRCETGHGSLSMVLANSLIGRGRYKIRATTTIFKNSFGCDDLSAFYLLVCGREASMNSTEKKRFFWRGQNISFNGKIAACLTYDGVLLMFETTLEAIKSCR
jgi:hypothetical protein